MSIHNAIRAGNLRLRKRLETVSQATKNHGRESLFLPKLASHLGMEQKKEKPERKGKQLLGVKLSDRK